MASSSQPDPGDCADEVNMYGAFQIDGPLIGSITNRSCDACRIRKTRCDRNSPCSYCKYAKVPCNYSEVRPRKKPPPSQLSARHEEKIDRIASRLEDATRLLHELKMNIPAQVPHACQASPPTVGNSSGRSAQAISSSEAKETTIPYDRTQGSPFVPGESSFKAHARFVRSFLETMTKTGYLQDASAEFQETINTLHMSVDALDEQDETADLSFPNARYTQCPSYEDYELPPMQKIVALIARSEGRPPETSGWVHEFLPLAHLSALCIQVYSKNFSKADFIIVNAGLFFLFQDLSSQSEQNAENERFTHMCRINLETALASLPLYLPATHANITALILGSFYTIESSKPLLSWSLSCKAAELCQTLGYHRPAPVQDGCHDMQRKLLFWTAYFVNKSLSLRLGRASCIQDWDIAAPVPQTNPAGPTPMSAFSCLWARTARVQGRIYELLYSPGSMLQPDGERELRVHGLVHEIQDIRQASIQIANICSADAKARIGHAMVDVIVVSDDVLRLSLLTLVYRASPRPLNLRSTFVPECVETARATLQRHHELMAIMLGHTSNSLTSYIHWTLLFAPFISFIIIFCHVMETNSEDDLARLYEFIVSIEEAPAASDAATKMYRLFQVLHSVALHSFRFTTSTYLEEQSEEGAELNDYLCALGLPPLIPAIRQQEPIQSSQNQDEGYRQMLADGDRPERGGGRNGGSPMPLIGGTAQLEEWLHSNQEILERLQDPKVVRFY